MRRHSEWNVQMIGQGWSSRPKSRSGRPEIFSIRCFISPAALFVKVIERIELAGMPWLIRYATRRVITRVLPLPAPAMISSGPSTCVTASRCASVRSESSSSVEITSVFVSRKCEAAVYGGIAPNPCVPQGQRIAGAAPQGSRWYTCAEYILPSGCLWESEHDDRTKPSPEPRLHRHRGRCAIRAWLRRGLLRAGGRPFRAEGGGQDVPHRDDQSRPGDDEERVGGHRGGLDAR